ncbi:ATP-binding protein [Myxococcota bacterium]|nr:ATP-binding protein [Myxococcota bacterium]
MGEGLRPLGSWRGLLGVALPIALIAALHYGAPHHAEGVHDVARRLFYVPIVLGAALGGLPGGVLTALLVWLVYFPHAFLPSFHPDPADSTQKALEMGFYVVLGALSGSIVDRLRSANQRLQDSLAQVRARDAQLARAARLEALGQLTAGLAHEIKNPLHAMRGTAEIVLDAVPPGTEERSLGQALIGEIDRLDGLLTRFLGFARRGAGEIGPLDLGQVLLDVETLVRAQAARQGTTVQVLPGQAQALAARDEVVQVALGICLNALQALERGGTVRMMVQDGPPRLRIENDGPSIPAHLLDRVFDPFVSGRPGGTGLGLSTAWSLVQGMGGTIRVDNLRDGGVAFEICLPQPSTDTAREERR